MTVIAVGVQLAADEPDSYKAGPIGLLLLLLMGVAIVFLVRSMGRHLRKVPASFDTTSTRTTTGGDRVITDGSTDSSTDASAMLRGVDDDSDGERGPATR